MSNAIVYSIHVEEDSLKQNYSFEQLRLSILSLRKYNEDIQVYVYISPSYKVDQSVFRIPKNNLNFVRFIAEYDSRLEHAIYSIWTSHKWKNAFEALRKNEHDNVLYVDTDTIFKKDPEMLFTKYGNTGSVIGKPDVSDKWTSIFNVSNGGMNDGVFMLSKHTLKYEEELLQYRVDYVYKLQEKFRYSRDEELKDLGIQWVACQYGVSEYLLSVGNPLKFFDDQDVYNVGHYDAYKKLPEEYKEDICITHYLSYNMIHFAPSAKKIYDEARRG